MFSYGLFLVNENISFYIQTTKSQTIHLCSEIERALSLRGPHKQCHIAGGGLSGKTLVGADRGSLIPLQATPDWRHHVPTSALIQSHPTDPCPFL